MRGPGHPARGWSSRAGAQPLLVRVDRASDIRQVLKLPQMYPGIRLVLVSANEGWLVANEIARAGVPVITLGMNNRPDSFEALGATMSNVGRLAAAGVKVALGGRDPMLVDATQLATATAPVGNGAIFTFGTPDTYPTILNQW